MDAMTTTSAVRQWHFRPSLGLMVFGGMDGGLSGQLPSIVCEHGTWPSYAPCLSGPPDMIRGSLDARVSVGRPAHRIRHDVFQEHAAARS